MKNSIVIIFFGIIAAFSSNATKAGFFSDLINKNKEIIEKSKNLLPTSSSSHASNAIMPHQAKAVINLSDKKEELEEENQNAKAGVILQIFNGISNYLTEKNKTVVFPIFFNTIKPIKLPPVNFRPAPINMDGKTDNQKTNFSKHTKVEQINLMFPDKEALKHANAYLASLQKKPNLKNFLVKNDPLYKKKNEKHLKMLSYLEQGRKLQENNYKIQPLGNNSNNAIANAVAFVHHVCQKTTNKKQSFHEGTFIIEDNNEHAIYHLLKNCAQEINKPANILNDYLLACKKAQRANKGIKITDKEYSHYKITLPENHFLPQTRMKHLVFGYVNKAQNTFFLKMLESDEAKQPSWFETFVPQAVSSYFSNPEEQTEKVRLEKVPYFLVSQYLKLYPQQTVPAKGLGITHMYKQLKQDVEQTQQECNLNNPKTALLKQIEKKYDNLDLRIGNEVILRNNELYGSLGMLQESIAKEIRAIEQTMNLENHRILTQENSLERIATLASTIPQELRNYSLENQQRIKNSFIKNKDELEQLKESLPNVVTLISDVTNEDTFYKDYETSLNHLTKLDATIDLKKLYEKIGLKTELRYQYTHQAVMQACDSRNQGTQTTEGQLIRQIKFTLGSEQGKKTYDAYLLGAPSLFMQRITQEEASIWGLDYGKLSKKITHLKNILEELIKKIS